MNESEIITKLQSKGGKLWEKEGRRRIYFNPECWGLEVTKYKTGSINTAEINGSRISNSEAYRCQIVKVWYDITTGKFEMKGVESLHGTAREAIDQFVATALD